MSVNSCNHEEMWRSAPPNDVAWLTSGNDHIAYHRPSGCTHFLNIASRELISEILQQPLDAESILSVFGISKSDPDWLTQLGEMRTTLEQLERLGFVERL